MQKKTKQNLVLGVPTFGEGGGGRPGWDKIPNFSKNQIWKLPLLCPWKHISFDLMVSGPFDLKPSVQLYVYHSGCFFLTLRLISICWFFSYLVILKPFQTVYFFPGVNAAEQYRGEASDHVGSSQHRSNQTEPQDWRVEEEERNHIKGGWWRKFNLKKIVFLHMKSHSELKQSLPYKEHLL